MSLPKGMEWKEETGHPLERRYFTCVGVTGTSRFAYQDGYLDMTILGRESLLDVRDRAHAELIIRAIEAPETLEIREES